MMNRRLLFPLLTLAASVALLSCSRNLQMPPGLDEQLSYSERLRQEYPVERQWWKAYHDPGLDGLVELALANNIDLAKSAVSVNKALYQANKLGAELLPQFSADMSASVGKDIKSGDSSVRDWSGEFSISYELDLWRRLADAATAQEWEYKATLEDLESARLALINSVVDAYFQLAYLRRAVQLRRDNVDYYREISLIMQAKYDAGKTDLLEPAKAEQSLLAAQVSLLELESAEKEAEQMLRNLLNLRPTDALTLELPDIANLSLPGVNLAVPLSVLANRPDLRAAEDRVRGTFKAAEASQKSLYPSITLGAVLSSASEQAAAMFDTPFTSALITIDFPFLRWNTLKWDIKISEAEFEEAVFDFEKSVTEALNEVDAYYLLYQKALEKVGKSRKKYLTDVRISAYYQARYTEGSVELSDWLDALGEENASGLSLLQDVYAAVQYENALYKSMAGRY